MCASAIFVVGTSGILPKIIYRSVKSYKLTREGLLIKLANHTTRGVVFAVAMATTPGDACITCSRRFCL